MPTLDELATDPFAAGTPTPKGLDELAGLTTTPRVPAKAPTMDLDTLAREEISSPRGTLPRTGGVGVEDQTPPSVIPGLAGVKSVAKKVWNAPGDITQGLWTLLSQPEAVGERIGKWVKGVPSDPVGSALDLVGPRTKATVQGRSFDPLFAGEDPLSGVIETLWEGAMARLNLGVVQKPAAMAAAIGATKLGERFPTLAKAATPAVNWALPRAGWTDPLTAAGAAKQGEIFYGSAAVTTPVAESVFQLPDYARKFLEPKLGGAPGEANVGSPFGREGPAFNKALSAPGGLPTNPLTGEQNYFGKYADFAIDQQGYIRNLHPEQFAKLGWDEQQIVLNARAVVDGYTKEIVRRKILAPEDVDPGWLRRAYETNIAPKEWRTKLMDLGDPEGRKIRSDLVKYFEDRKFTNPEAHAQGIIDRDPTILAKLGFAVPGSPYGQAATSLIPRVNIPDPIRAALGPIAPGPMRLGSALDYQQRILANDLFLEKATRIMARDGNPFVMPDKGGTPVAGALTTKGTPFEGYRQLENTDIFGRWRKAWVHPDLQDAIGVLQGDTLSGPIASWWRAWKGAKVIGNPATWWNNMGGNATTYTTAVGASMLNPANAANYRDALGHMYQLYKNPVVVAHIPELQQAILDGAVHPGYAHSEFSNMFAVVARQPGDTALQSWVNASMEKFLPQAVKEKWAVHMGYNAAVDLPPGAVMAGMKSSAKQSLAMFYDLQDQYARYGSYLTLTRRGMSSVDAALEVAKYFPNYDVSSKLGGFLRGERSLEVAGKKFAPSAVGPLFGGPFSSFPIEASRIYTLLAKEHPLRGMAIASIPLSLVTVFSGLRGLTLNDYVEFNQNLPSYHRGKLWIPMPGGGMMNWTPVEPLGEWSTEHPALSRFLGRQVPQGPLGMPLVSPGGPKMVNPERGDEWVDLFWALTKELAPVPQGALRFLEGQGKRVGGVPYEAWEEEPESVGTSFGRAVAPQIFTHPPEDWFAKQRRNQELGQMDEYKRGFKSLLKRPNVSEADKERKAESLKDRERALREKKY